ncbi:MAG: M23 family metallopeptidase [Actinomycetia bacterium]|nr:M23 family metallopeptidase [Actinomycetes bacterium]
MRTSPAPHRPTAGARLALAVALWILLSLSALTVAPRSAATPGAGAGHNTVDIAAGADAVWAWPLSPLPQVGRVFERPPTRYAAGHRGVDLVSAEGRPVLAVDDGVVSHSGMVAGRGTVSVQHDNGLRSTYEPLVDRIPTGTQVSAGEALGTLAGPSHCPETTCLHLGARLGEEYLDPLLLLTRARIILLPLLPGQ